MASTNPDPTLVLTLKQADETLAFPNEDLRGRTVGTKDGEQIGKVDTLLVDSQENHVRYRRVESGGFLHLGEKKVLIPVDAVTNVASDTVFVDQSTDKVVGAPIYDPQIISDDEYYEDLYDYYGYLPHWRDGYNYPI